MEKNRDDFEEDYMNYSNSYIIEYPKGNTRDDLLIKDIKSILNTDRNVGPFQHEDVHYMTSTGKQGYRVADVDRFIESLKMMPHGRISVGVIDNADTMSEIVQNKLLKTIEEPPNLTVILLVVSNRQRLLSTIRSRCKIRIYEGSSDKRKLEESCEEGSKSGYLSDSFFESNYFFQFRKSIEKEIENKDLALKLVDEIEKRIFEYYIDAGNDIENICYSDLIGICEDTRMDILNGMGFKQALKRLFLDFH